MSILFQLNALMGLALNVHPVKPTLPKLASGAFTLSITDKNTGQSFTVTEKMKRAKRYSAEVIAEAPWSGGVLPLADFGSVSFTQALFNGASISSFSNNQITMVTSSGAPKATPSALDATSGSAFTITWNRY